MCRCQLLSEADADAAAVAGGGAVIGVAAYRAKFGGGGGGSDGGGGGGGGDGGGGVSRTRELAERIFTRLEPAMVALLLRHAAALALPSDAAEQAGAIRSLVRESLLAFCNGDLLHAGRALLGGARGSFGLVLSHSLDAHSDFLVWPHATLPPKPYRYPDPNPDPNQVAARGQTMSIAFYPLQRLVLFGSEARAYT